jgi:predicted 3-demethylubiquinone-9 3-methyltransferase (glyoxalase superfamily)
MMQKITLFLWFDNRAEEAMRFYVSLFKNSKIRDVARIPDGPGKGDIVGTFQLEGQEFMAIDGGPYFQLSPAISLFVNCSTRQEVDGLWERLVEGGTVLMPLEAYPFSERFGWLADKFGVSWQLNVGARPQKITPFFLFAGQQHGRAEEAVTFYTSIFDDSGITSIERFGAGEEVAEGSVKQAVFSLAGQEFMAMDGGPGHAFTFTGAVSLYVDCKTQEEVDALWEKLSEGGEIQQCGWLKDKYGVFWQIIPTVLTEMMQDTDKARWKRAFNAMLQMKKLDIGELTRASESGAPSEARH